MKDEDKFCTACGTPTARVVREEFTVSSDDLIERVKQLLHEGNITTQTRAGAGSTKKSAVVQLDNVYNAFCFGNGVESDRIRDDFNGSLMQYSPRVLSTIENYEQEQVTNGLTYSGVFREDTGTNRLNEFNLSTANFRYVDRFFGSIQKLYARDTDLVVFQENKVSVVLYEKNLISDSVG